MSKRSEHYLISILALVWFVIVVIFYYLIHKPISPDLAFNIMKIIGRIFVVFCVTAIGGGIGLRFLPVVEIGRLTNLSLQSAFGLGVLGLLVLIIGTIVGITPLYCWLGVLMLGIIFWRAILQWIRSWSEFSKMWYESQRFGKVIGFGTFLILLSTLVTASAPALKFDSLVYHLTLPEAYLTNGQLSYVPENIFWGMPQIGEMLYTYVIALGGIQTATVFGWMFGVLALVGLFGYANYRYGLEIAWVTIASLLAGYTFSVSLGWGYVDWLGLLYGLAVLVYLDNWRIEGDSKKLMFAGIFSGIGLGVKYTTGVIILAGIGVILYQVVKVEAKWKRVWVYLLSFVMPAIVVSFPWWIKNVLGTGNPFYPFLIPAGAMDQFRLQFYQIPSWGNWQDILFLPLRATILGVEGAPGYSASIGPLLFALSPLALLGWSQFDQDERTTLTTAALIVIVGIGIWVIAGRLSAYLIQSRLYSSIFPAVALLAGLGFYSMGLITWNRIRFRKVVETLVLFVFTLAVFEVSLTTINQGATEAILNVQNNDDYLNENLGWYGPAMKAIRELPEGSKVLMLWEPRSLYCLPKCIPDEIIDRWIHDRYKYGDQISILRSWREADYTHLLYYKSGADFIRKESFSYSNSDWEALDELLDELSILEDFGGAYYLYTLE